MNDEGGLNTRLRLPVLSSIRGADATGAAAIGAAFGALNSGRFPKEPVAYCALTLLHDLMSSGLFVHVDDFPLYNWHEKRNPPDGPGGHPL